mmetsp:Transcript_44822/g.128002  ORF Transcript_44822/g.128002 Transcript_44822/m.128002 type:complete len:245 (+) Transcript_44822:2084-2818(+)
MKVERACFWSASLPMTVLIIRSTVSQSHPHATSCAEFQSLGTRERREASITALYSSRLTGPLHFTMRKEIKSHSSWSLPGFVTFVTTASKDVSTSRIQAWPPKPMTAALNWNISLKVFGTFTAFFPSLRPASSAPETPPEVLEVESLAAALGALLPRLESRLPAASLSSSAFSPFSALSPFQNLPVSLPPSLSVEPVEPVSCASCAASSAAFCSSTPSSVLSRLLAVAQLEARILSLSLYLTLK